MNITEIIRDTPIIKLEHLEDDNSATIWAKLENLGYTGSHKDRVAIAFLTDAQNKNFISPGVSTIIEASDGNMGISLASFCKSMGFKLTVVMPEYVNEERIEIIKAYEAEVVLTPKSDGLKGAIEKAKSISSDIDGSYFPNQFENHISVDIHKEVTAKEIIEQTNGNLDIFVSGYSTGGIFTGISEILKDYYPDIRIVAVEPDDSIDLSDSSEEVNNIFGIGPGFMPSNLNESIIDEIITVKDTEAKEYTKILAKRFGILVGKSSGASYFAANKVAKSLGRGKQILTIFFDTGERYLSTGLYR